MVTQPQIKYIEVTQPRQVKLRNFDKKCIIFFMPTELIRKQFLLTEEENERIEEKAKQLGLSVSNYTRKLHGLKPLEKGGARIKQKESNNKSKA